VKTSIIVNSEFFGDIPEELGPKIMGNFFRKLCLENNKPDKILFYGSGVKLAAKGTSHVLDALEILFREGVDLIVCKTCVEYYDLKDKIHIGRVCSMQEVVTIMMNSDKVITVT